jgi:RNA polymerase sigma factor (sigma-70 family)
LVSAAAGAAPDQHLLERFVAHKDEAAFAALVEWHGPMVLGVAWNVLHHRQDAEDVFQATFLVLARQAGSVRKQGSVGSWLHGVAYRLALKSRTAAASRHRHERSAPARAPAESPDDLTWRELSAILHAELERLPGRYRAPLVLCYLEGMTQDQAAEHLGMPKGTLKGRLERARLLLRGRLVRLGLAPAVVLLADAYRPAGAALPPAVASTTARAAAAFAAGRAAGVSAQVARLAEGVLKAMFVIKVRSAALLLVIGLFLAGGGVLVSRAASGRAAATDGPAARDEGERAGAGGDREPPWGEAVGGWRMRLTLPAGAEYRRNTPLPLLLEVRNVSDGPLPLASLAYYADPEVTEAGKRLVARPPIDVSPWEGRRDRLPAGASLMWTLDFDRIRFSTEPLKAGTTLQVRFRLPIQDEPPQAGRQRLLFSNEVSLKLRDDHPSLMTGPDDLPPKWVDSMEVAYRELLGLAGYRALRIDGAGRAVVVSIGHGKGQPITGLVRTEAVLNRERLDRLARFLREQKVWELADPFPVRIANPDEGEDRVSVGMGHGSLVGTFPNSMVRADAKLLALRTEMQALMDTVVKDAAAKESREKQSPTRPDPPNNKGTRPDPPAEGQPDQEAPVEKPVWGKPLNGLRLGLCRAAPKEDGKLRLLVVLENVSAADLTVKLGLMLANGKTQLPTAVRFLVTGGDGQERLVRRTPPGVAGRVDPFVVPLSSGNRYSISCDLDQWDERPPPGRYRVRAEFVGAAVTRQEVNLDTTGLALMTYWAGTISSAALPVTLPAKPAR